MKTKKTDADKETAAKLKADEERAKEAKDFVDKQKEASDKLAKKKQTETEKALAAANKVAADARKELMATPLDADEKEDMVELERRANLGKQSLMPSAVEMIRLGEYRQRSKVK